MPINFAVKLAVTVAMEAAQMGLQASKRTKGPRLDELTVTTSEYGTPLPRFLGTRKFATAIIHAEDLKEVEKTSKIKGGGKQTTYHYLATFAAAISDCPIDKVLRIWFDDKLVYDATGTGPISYASALGIDLDSVMRVYKGTEDQLPDPRYESWCEDKYGPDSAPAYRGVSYLFFEEMPVDNFGNRIPQITVLAASATATAYPYQQVPATLGYTAGEEVNGTWMIRWSNGSAGAIEWWDAPSRTLLGVSTGVGADAGTVTNVDLASDGTAYFVGMYTVFPDVFSALYTCPPLGQSERMLIPSAPAFAGPTRVFDLASGPLVLCGVSGTTGYIQDTAVVADTQAGRDFALHGDGSLWGIFQPNGTSNQLTLSRLSDGHSITFTGLVTRSATSNATFCHVHENAHFFVICDGKWYTIADDTTATPGAIKASGTWTAGDTNNLPRKSPGSVAFWSNYTQISLADGSTLQSANASDWLVEDSGGNTNLYVPVLDGLVVHPQFASHITIRYLNRVGANSVTLGDIVDAMCAAAALSDRDTSALTQTVAGYSWTRGDVKSQMEPVIDIHDVDARGHDFSIEFLPRGSAPVGTILTRDFVKAGGDTPRYKVTIAQDTDLPATLRLNFADTGFDQQTNNVLSPLPADSVDTQRDAVIDGTTYAASPAEAQQLADRYMRREWNSRETIENALTAQCLAMEPGDVTTLDLDGSARNVRLTKQTSVGGRIECTFVRDETSVAAINSATAGPSMNGREPSSIAFPAPVVGFVIDAPYRSDTDQDVRPLLYAGAGSYAGLSYPGAAIYEATGTGTSRAFDQLFAGVTSGATWGLCSGALASADANLWDRGNTLNVSLQSGMLTSVSEDDINADPALNLILVGSNAGGWEYVNFTTATLNGDGTYTLSGFKRGRRGTEWMCGGHTAAEAWIMASSLGVEEMGADQVGGSFAFKTQAVGRSIDTATEIDLTYAAETLKPYAPARIKWTTDGTDMFGEIIRRTRVGGAWVGGSAIPLSENSEAYEIDVYHSGVLKRTIAVSGINTFTYTGVQIAADGNSVGVPPATHAYQLSDAVGRGFALAA